MLMFLVDVDIPTLTKSYLICDSKIMTDNMKKNKMDSAIFSPIM